MNSLMILMQKCLNKRIVFMVSHQEVDKTISVYLAKHTGIENISRRVTYVPEKSSFYCCASTEHAYQEFRDTIELMEWLKSQGIK